jgi:succinate dehydrogenase/fumarate reductase iron-sulfur protein
MKIKINKYDPATDAEPYYIEHDVAFKEKMTLLEAIVTVHENFEAVAYDYSCHGRMCGRCAVMLDGVPSLACSTPLKDADHTIEPLKGMTVIRDLIVDKSDLDDRLSKQYLRVRTEPIKEEEINDFDGEKAKIIYNVANCTRCGICDASCPARAATPDQYVGPATMTAVAFRFYDSFDQADRVLEAVSKGMYHCIMCGKCDEVCPRPEIKHVEMWKALRAEAEKRSLKPSYAA